MYRIKALPVKEITDLVISYNQAIELYEESLAEAENQEDRDAATWVLKVAEYRKMLLECKIKSIAPLTRGI